MEIEITTTDRIRLKQFVDRELDKLYTDASKLGMTLGSLFTGTNTSQLRNMESVVSAATRTSDLKNYIKNQVGKDIQREEKKKNGWSLPNENSSGRQTLKLIDSLPDRARSIVKELALNASTDVQHELARITEIDLQRGVVETVVCTALYSGNMENVS